MLMTFVIIHNRVLRATESCPAGSFPTRPGLPLPGLEEGSRDPGERLATPQSRASSTGLGPGPSHRVPCSKGPVLSLSSVVAALKIIIIFERARGGGDYYYFAASPARYVAGSGPALTHHLQQRSLETDFIVSWTLHVILVIFSLHFLASPFSGIIAAPGIKDVLVRCSFYYEMHIANEDSNTGTV